MNSTPIKTTMLFSPSFHLRLKRFSEREGKPMGQIVEQTINPVLAQAEQARLKRLYDGLFALEGMVKGGSPNASATIDEVVYGGVTEPYGK